MSKNNFSNMRRDGQCIHAHGSRGPSQDGARISERRGGCGYTTLCVWYHELMRMQCFNSPGSIPSLNMGLHRKMGEGSAT